MRPRAPRPPSTVSVPLLAVLAGLILTVAGATAASADAVHGGRRATAPPVPTISPASGSMLTSGSVVTVGGSGTATIDVTLDAMPVVGNTFALPYTFTVPNGSAQLAPGRHTLNVQATATDPVDGSMSSADAGYDVAVPDTVAPVVYGLSAPKSYFPVADGYLDLFTVRVKTNESAVAALTIFRGGESVSRVTRRLAAYGPFVDVSAGRHLRPGHYTWQLSLTDAAGNVTRTRTAPLTADSRHVVEHALTTTYSAASKVRTISAGTCSTARTHGRAVELDSDTRCRGNYGSSPASAQVGLAVRLHPGVGYAKLRVTVHTDGIGDTLINQNLADLRSLDGPPVTDDTTEQLPDRFVGLPDPLLGVFVSTNDGHHLDVTALTLSYVYETLAR